MRLLAVGDMHLGRVPVALPEGLAAMARLLGPETAWQRCVEQAISLEVEAVLLAGDVVDRERDFFAGYASLKAGIENLLEHGIRVIAAAGRRAARDDTAGTRWRMGMPGVERRLDHRLVVPGPTGFPIAAGNLSAARTGSALPGAAALRPLPGRQRLCAGAFGRARSRAGGRLAAGPRTPAGSLRSSAPDRVSRLGQRAACKRNRAAWAVADRGRRALGSREPDCTGAAGVRRARPGRERPRVAHRTGRRHSVRRQDPGRRAHSGKRPASRAGPSHPPDRRTPGDLGGERCSARNPRAATGVRGIRLPGIRRQDRRRRDGAAGPGSAGPPTRSDRRARARPAAAGGSGLRRPSTTGGRSARTHQVRRRKRGTAACGRRGFERRGRRAPGTDRSCGPGDAAGAASMKLVRLTVDKLPGIEDRLELAPSPDRASVVVGPNASGKTSLIRALAALLQRRPDNRPVQIEAEFVDGEHRIKGSAIGQARTWSLDGVGVDRPDWPGDEQLAAYLIRADELADAGSTEQQFSDALRRVMAGGFDLDALARTSPFEKPPGPKKLAREFDQTERALQALEARHAELAADIDGLESLREQQRESIEAQRRLQAQKRALELLGLEQQMAAARQALARFPEGMHRLDGREGERLARLDEEIEQRRQRLRRTRQNRAEAARTLA